MTGSALRQLHRHLTAWLTVAFVALGLVVAVLLPPFYVPDERSHWLAAQHRISRGETCSFDVSLAEHFREGVRFQPEKKLPADQFARIAELAPACEKGRFYRFGNVFSYPGVLLVRALRPSEPENGQEALAGFLIARFLQGLLVATVLFRIAWLGRAAGAPAGLLCLLAIGLSPLLVQQSFGVTSDTVVNAFALALAGWLALPDRLTRADHAAVAALGVVAMLTKPVLAPVLPAVLLLRLALGAWLRGVPSAPAAGLVAEVRATRGSCAMALGLTLLGLGYMWATRHVGSTGGTQQAAGQLDFALSNPGIVWHALTERIGAVFGNPGLLAEPLGYLDTELSSLTRRALAGLVALAAALDVALLTTALLRLSGARDERMAARPWLLVATGAAVLLLLALAASAVLLGFKMYLIATPLGSEQLRGFQPRYLLPYLALGLGALLALGRGIAATAPAAPDAETGALARIGIGLGLSAAAVLLLVYTASLAADLLRRYG